MILLNNTQETGTFSLTLRDKLTRVNPHLYIKLTKIDDKSFIYFHLENQSTSNRYYTFTIPTSSLKDGQYRVQVFQGYPEESDDCLIDENTTVALGIEYICNPLTLEATLNLEDEAVITSVAVLDEEIYETVGRVEGTTYNQVYSNDSEPEIYSYNG